MTNRGEESLSVMENRGQKRCLLLHGQITFISFIFCDGKSDNKAKQLYLPAYDLLSKMILCIKLLFSDAISFILI